MSLTPVMRVAHYEGTATTTPVKIELQNIQGNGAAGFRIIIKNLEVAPGNALDISFNGGRTFFPIAAGAELDVNAKFHYFFLRGVGGDADYNALVAQG